MKANNYNISYFICPECNKSFPLPRPKSLKRNKGHIKDLYCFYCKKDVKANEVRNKDYYVITNNTIIYC